MPFNPFKLIYPKKRDNFVVIGLGRTKTNLLVSLLNQHPEIYCHGELFNPHFIGYRGNPKPITAPELQFIVDKEFQTSQPIQYIKQVFQDTKKERNQRIIGYKHLYEQQEIVRAYISSTKKIKKIIPVRNPLFTYTSWKIAEASEQWVLPKGVDKMDAKISLDPLSFLNNYRYQFKSLTGYIRELQLTRQKYHIVFSEDLPSWQAMEDIFDFLGVSTEKFPLKIRLQKQNSSHFYDRLLNPEEIQQLFSGTILETLSREDKVIDRDFWIKTPLDKNLIEQKLREILSLHKKVSQEI